jgi:hypothetical protein
VSDTGTKYSGSVALVWQAAIQQPHLIQNPSSILHDDGKCALNNLRLAGNDYFKIMSMSGHKTMAVFKRYNLVTEEELSQIKWPEKGGITGIMDTNGKKRLTDNG